MMRTLFWTFPLICFLELSACAAREEMVPPQSAHTATQSKSSKTIAVKPPEAGNGVYNNTPNNGMLPNAQMLSPVTAH